jgi:DNA end-binding protein Ku
MAARVRHTRRGKPVIGAREHGREAPSGAERLPPGTLGGAMRTVWNGSINFGLVNIPIGLAVAQQRQDVAFRTLHRECGTPIKQKRYCPKHERDVEADELVKGWEFSKGQFVVVEDSDFEAVALERSQSIDIVRFVPVDEVDPIYFDRTYYLAPASAVAQRRPYVLLLEAMKKTGLGAVGKFVLWGKENLCLVRPLGDSLALETLYFAEDVRSRAEIDEAVQETDVNDPELAMAVQLVESLAGAYEPGDFRNEYRGELRAMLEAKLTGEEITRPEPIAPTPVVDLMEALRTSVAQAKAQREPAKRTRAKKTPAGGRQRAATRR